ncbi:MAG: PilZ domain-containing protein [Alphaproteobacteria bacterium]|nr:PilZ domain-containing protein [Alphaproteobacteria bacterium]
MFQALFSKMRARVSNDPIETRRAYPRRRGDRCVIEIADQTFPVDDWSYNGALVSGDERLFAPGEDVAFTLKFKLRDRIVSVAHDAHVVRKQNGKIALAFTPPPAAVVHGFQQVVDDAAASEFAGSQAG